MTVFNLFFLLFGIAIALSLITSNWVKVENALAAYLPGTAETTQALDRMEEQFTTYGSAEIMVSNITYDNAEKIAKEIEQRDDVAMLQFDNTSKHFNNFSALYNITFAYPEDDQRDLDGLEEIKEMFREYDIYVSSSLGNAHAEQIEKEMQTVSVIVAIIVLTVLVFTSET